MINFRNIRVIASIALILMFFVMCPTKSFSKQEEDSQGEVQQSFIINSPFTGRELPTISKLDTFIPSLAENILELQKLSLGVAEEGNETRFIKQQIVEIFGILNSTLYRFIAITPLMHELSLDSFIATNEFFIIKSKNSKQIFSDVKSIKKNVQRLKNKIKSLQDFVNYSLTSEKTLNNELSEFIARINRMAVNEYSGVVRECCLTILNRINRQEISDIAYLKQFADMIKTSLNTIAYINDDFFDKTPSGALNAVVLSTLSDVRRNLKFSIYLIKRNVKKSKRCYSVIASDTEEIKEKLTDFAKQKGANRFHIKMALDKDSALFFEDVSQPGIIAGLFRKARNVILDEKAKIKVSNDKLLQLFMTSLTDIPINLSKIEENMTAFKKSFKKNKPKKQKPAKNVEKKNKTDGLEAK